MIELYMQNPVKCIYIETFATGSLCSYRSLRVPWRVFSVPTLYGRPSYYHIQMFHSFPGKTHTHTHNTNPATVLSTMFPQVGDLGPSSLQCYQQSQFRWKSHSAEALKK